MIYKKFKEIFKNVKQQNPLLMGRVDYLVETHYHNIACMRS